MKSCFLVQHDLALVYVYPVYGPKYDTLAERFVRTYLQFKPAIGHVLHVIANGGKPNKRMENVFRGVDVIWGVHNNSGYDIGAYQFAARTAPPSRLMGFFGASAYLRGPSWLERMYEVSEKHGLGLYGSMGHMGDPGSRVYPHIRTTGFFMRPELLNSYPYGVVATSQRYEFEHGVSCLTEFCKALELPRIVVTFNGEYPFPLWDTIPNGYHRGTQSEIMTGDRLTEPPYYPPGSK